MSKPLKYHIVLDVTPAALSEDTVDKEVKGWVEKEMDLIAKYLIKDEIACEVKWTLIGELYLAGYRP